MGIASINPTTGTTIQVFDEISDANLDAKLAQAAETFLTYRHTSFDQRGEWMRAAATVLDTNKQAYAKLMTLEMGKPLASAVAEVEKSAWVCRFYADHAADFLRCARPHGCQS